MADDKKSLLKTLGPSLAGGLDPQTGLSGRRFERTQGCWNCIHCDFKRGKEYWLDKREKDLETAVTKATASPEGENDNAVVNIRRMVAAIDQGLAFGTLTKCFGPGVDANDNPVGDFVKSNYLCRKWSAATGASIAREGQKADDLPMELEDKHN